MDYARSLSMATGQLRCTVADSENKPSISISMGSHDTYRGCSRQIIQVSFIAVLAIGLSTLAGLSKAIKSGGGGKWGG